MATILCCYKTVLVLTIQVPFQELLGFHPADCYFKNTFIVERVTSLWPAPSILHMALSQPSPLSVVTADTHLVAQPLWIGNFMRSSCAFHPRNLWRYTQKWTHDRISSEVLFWLNSKQLRELEFRSETGRWEGIGYLVLDRIEER